MVDLAGPRARRPRPGRPPAGAALDAATATPVRFELRREAGDTAFQGTFRRGKGSGAFTFTPRPPLLDEVRALGVEVGSPDPKEQLFGLAMHDVTVAYIRGMIDEGYRVAVDDYLPLRIFGVTPEYVRAMGAVGFPRLSYDDLLASWIQGVTPDHVRDMRAQGWDLSFDAYLAGRIHGVTPRFAQQMKKLGYGDLSHDDLVAFRIQGVTGEFILEMRDLGYAELSADDLLAARIHGVTPEFIHEVERAGFKDVPFDQLVDLRIRGVDPRQLAKKRVD